MRKARIVLPILLAVAILLCAVFAMTVSGASGVAVKVSDDFTSGKGNTSGQNNMSHGGAAQSKLELAVGADGGGYAVFSPTATGTNPGHAFVQNSFGSGGVVLSSAGGNKYMVYDIDFTTETQYFESLVFEMIGKDSADKTVNTHAEGKVYVASDGAGGWNITANSKTLPMESERGRWQHLTIVIEAARDSSGATTADSKSYVYYNGRFLSSGKAQAKAFSYMHSMRISMNSGASVSIDDTLCIDNVTVTAVADSYSGNLAAVLADSSKSLTEWTDAVYKSGYTFPKTRAIAEVGGKKLSTASEIEAAITEGALVNLLSDVLDTVDIPNECSVYNDGGYTFNYNKGSFGEYKSAKTTAFLNAFASPVTVTWHIGDETVTETYDAPAVLTPPEFEETVEIGGVLHKALGYSRSEGGEMITDPGIASPYNNEFYVVFERSVAYALHSDGTKSYAYSEEELDALMLATVSGDTVYLLSDLKAGVTGNAACYTFTGKSVTLDLSGYTLTMAGVSNNHLFTVGKNGSLTVKNGVIDALDNGRIPEGGTAIVRRNVFKIPNDASGAYLLAEDLTVKASKMMTVVGNGEAVLRRCKIDFTNDYENMIDFYSNGSETSPTTLRLEECDIRAYKTVVNSYKPSDVTGNYSELYARNCNINTNERIFTVNAISKAEINGGTYTGTNLFANENANKSAKVYIYRNTYFSLEDLDQKNKLLIITDGKLVRSGREDCPYAVTDKYAKIKWDILGEEVSELWAMGAIPECPIKIPHNTSALRYDMEKPIPVSGYKLYNLEAKLNFTPKISATLDYDFGLNLYVPDADYKSVALGDMTFEKSEGKSVLISGEPYLKFSLNSIAASAADEKIPLSFSFDTEAGELSLMGETSVISYLESVIEGGSSFDEYNLALSALNYINASQGDVASAELTEMLAKYDTSTVVYAMAKTDASMAALGGVISESKIENGKYIFTYDTNFTGNISFKYNISGDTVTEFFEISEGKDQAGGSYATLKAPALAYVTGVEVTAGSASGSFDLSAYAENVGMLDIYSAMYSYAKCIEAYIN